MLWSQTFRFYCRNNEFSEIDLPWTISIDDSCQKFDSLFCKFFFLKKSLSKLLGWNDTIMIMIKVLK